MEGHRVEWWWKSNVDPFSDKEPAEWSRYSDVENAIIEEAYQNKRTDVVLDDVHIDFVHQLQLSNHDVKHQRPIKRQSFIKTDQRLREARFMPDPISPSSSFHDLVGYRKIFIENVMEYLSLRLTNNWDDRRGEIVDRAMQGIIYEGKLAGKQCEGQWLAEQLNQVKNRSKGEIGQCSVRLYSMESFLYKVLNHTMRLIGDPDHEHIWRSKVKTLGPFAFLLHYYLAHENLNHRTNRTIYRGAQLSDEMIAEYRRVARSKDPRRSFQAFTSCSRNRIKAEQFGNVLFILNAERQISYRTLNMDIAALSIYPDEEEVLIPPGRAFKIERVEFDATKKKHLIYLTTISTSDKN